MTAYATQQDMIDRLGQETLESLAWDSDAGALDTAAVDRALTDAADEINARISKRYVLPLTSIPTLLKRVAVSLATYHLAGATTLSDDIEKRYNSSIKLLVSIAKGDADMGLPDAEKAQENKSGDIIITGPERRFTRDSLKGLF